jgi:hypothetical protein
MLLFEADVDQMRASGEPELRGSERDDFNV